MSSPRRPISIAEPGPRPITRRAALRGGGRPFIWKLSGASVLRAGTAEQALSTPLRQIEWAGARKSLKTATEVCRRGGFQQLTSIAAGDREHEACASFRPVFHPDAPAMQFDQVPDNRQTEPGPAGIARARLVDAVKALEHSRKILFGDARPLIR